MVRAARRYLATSAVAVLFTACASAGAREPPAAPADTAVVVRPEPRLPPRPDTTRRAPPPPDTARRVEAPPPRRPERERLLRGALLPTRRIVAYYGNPLSENMGILGQLPPDQMLARLEREVAAWEQADPGTPVQPALHMIAVVAAGDAGADGKFRIRQPKRAIDRVLSWAERSDAIVFLDIQPGRSTVQAELPHLLPYLRRPHVHLALDPEWAMGSDGIPGRRIGSLDVSAINHAIDTLARLVEEHGLPPKVLVVHRFTQSMVRNLAALDSDPRVQVVLNMDGWGPPSTKIAAYRNFVAPAPVQFKGFKLFYRNDTRGSSQMMTPAQILQLSPAPIYIQYQ